MLGMTKRRTVQIAPSDDGAPIAAEAWRDAKSTETRCWWVSGSLSRPTLACAWHATLPGFLPARYGRPGEL